MKTPTPNARPKNARPKVTQKPAKSPDVCQLITDAIIARLEAGVIPWKCPWSKNTLPANYLTKRAYNGINAFLLASFGHEHPYFLTFNQAGELGGRVRKGARSIPVIFYKLLDKTSPGAKENEKTPLLQYYRVFHISDIEGIGFRLPECTPNPQAQTNRTCEQTITSMPNPPRIVFEGSQPCYIPGTDTIRMTGIEKFASNDEYYQTLFHELVHATAHKSRLDRDISGGFGSHAYSLEELIAEMGASYLSALAGIASPAVMDNAAGYIQGWLKALGNDRKMLISAASKAQKAVGYITARKEEAGTEPIRTGA